MQGANWIRVTYCTCLCSRVKASVALPGHTHIHRTVQTSFSKHFIPASLFIGWMPHHNSPVQIMTGTPLKKPQSRIARIAQESSSHNEEMGSVLANSHVKLQDLQKDTASRVTKCDHDQAREIKVLQHRDSWDAIACLLGLDRNISTTTGWMA